jgi:heat shock protein HslJ
MDARLRQAGESWRATSGAQAVSDPVDVQPLSTPGRPEARRRRTGLLASAAVVAAALVAGGGVLVANLTGGNHRSANMDSAPLVGTVWELVGVDDVTLQSSFSTLYIKDGKLVTDDSCTLFGAHVSVDAQRLVVSDPQTRYYNCTDSVGELTFQPNVFLANPRYELTGDGLTISGAGSTLHLIPGTPLPAPTLDVPTFTDTDWRLVQATDANGAASPVDGDLGFRVEGGRFTADEGCNKLSGDVTYQGPQAELKTVDSTALPCPSPQPYQTVMQTVFQPGAVDVRIQGGALTLGRAGAGSLTYAWVPSDANATDPSAMVGHDWQLSSVAGAPASDGIGLYASRTELSVTFGCGAVGGSAHIGHGALHLDGVHDGAAPGCSGDIGDQSSTVDSLLAHDPLWRVSDGELVIFGGGGAQAFSLVFDPPQPQQPDNPPPLTGTEWELIAAKDANGTDVAVAGDGGLTIDADGHLTGNDGCNPMTGDVQVIDRTIDFGGGLAVTEMACAGQDVAATAQAVDQMLSGVVEWTIDGDQLTLVSKGAGTLTYRAGQPPTTSTDPGDLTGRAWALTTIESGTGPNSTAHSVTGDPRLKFDLGQARALQWDDGCNFNTAEATVGDGTLDIGDVGGTQVYCEQSNEVSAILQGHLTWVIAGDQLTITNDGVGALVYKQATVSSLAGTTWTFSSMQTDNANSGSGLATTMPVDLLFDDNHSYRLTTGCHAYAGDYSVSGSSITFSHQQDLGGVDCLDTVAQQLVDFLHGTMQWTTASRLVGATSLVLTKDNMKAIFAHGR